MGLTKLIAEGSHSAVTQLKHDVMYGRTLPILLNIEPVSHVTRLCYPFQVIHGSMIKDLVEKRRYYYTYPL